MRVVQLTEENRGAFPDANGPTPLRAGTWLLMSDQDRLLDFSAEPLMLVARLEIIRRHRRTSDRPPFRTVTEPVADGTYRLVA